MTRRRRWAFRHRKEQVEKYGDGADASVVVVAVVVVVGDILAAADDVFVDHGQKLHVEGF